MSVLDIEKLENMNDKEKHAYSLSRIIDFESQLVGAMLNCDDKYDFESMLKLRDDMRKYWYEMGKFLDFEDELKDIQAPRLNYKAPYELTKDKGDQGWDIRADKDTVLNPSETKLIDTGLYFEFRDGLYADVRARSGISSKGILCHTGLVDSDYRGEIKVCMTNLSNVAYTIKKGDRIAQLVFGKEVLVEPRQTKEIDTDTSRGDKGFGSSGKD